MILNQAQVDELRRIIQRYIQASIWLMTGVPPTDADFREIQKMAPGVPIDAIRDAYLYGMLTAIRPEVKHLPYDKVKKIIKDIPLGPVEKDAIHWLSTSAALYCRGLGNVIENGTLRIVHDADKEARMLAAIQDTLAAGAAARKTRSQIITDLRDATGDKSRDWHRIVNTELHNARTQGVARGISKSFGAAATVIVRPHPDCCDMCRAAYLHRGKPKVFKLADLAGRDNIGRKRPELVKAPALPPLHPQCFCEVIHFNPDIQEFDKDGRIVFKVKVKK
jgi:hypothetical protein